MPALGCLLFLILPLLGLGLGVLFASAKMAALGAMIGFVVAATIAGVGIYSLVKARRR
jgi:predicted Na+-dependent transporter